MLLHFRHLFILSVTVGTSYLLLNLFSSFDFITKIALFVLAINITDIFIRFVWNSLPSQTLPGIKEKAVFITGCDSGFGNELARQLDAKGATVFAGCLFAEGPGASKLKKDCSKNVHVVQIDVTKDKQVNSAAKYVTNTLNDKPLHALVNNAGIFSASEAEFMEVEELKRVLDVNTVGVARVTQAFLPLLRKSKGRLVITASLSSCENIPFVSAYSMSKHAVLSYANTIRRELMRWSISVHTIEPGIYNTEMKNKEVILSKLDNGFNHAPEETREAYGGEDYMKAYTKGYDFADYLQSKRIQEVIDCMLDAVIAKYPKFRYHPGLLGKWQHWTAMNLSQEINDLIYYLAVKSLIGTIHGKKHNVPGLEQVTNKDADK